MDTQVPTASSEEDKRLDACWDIRCVCRHNAWVQVRYHRRRQRFFELCDKVTKAVTVVLGASLMGQYFEKALPIVATAITSLGFLELVFGYGDRKQQHKELSEQAAGLVSAIERVPVGELTPERVAGWSSDYALMCAKSPPALKTLTIICEAEQSIADGKAPTLALPWMWRRMIADFKS